MIGIFFCHYVMKLLPTLFMITFYAFAAFESKAQEVFQSGSRFQALSDASVGLTGCWSAFGNQAGLAVVSNPVLAGSFQNRFLVNELSTRTGLIAVPVETSVFAFSLSQFGQIPFRQEKYGLAYARKISPRFNFGLQFNYYRLFLSEDNRCGSSYGVELGFQYSINEQLCLGLHLMNPYRTSIQLNNGSFQYPSRLNCGVLFHLSELISLSSEIQNDFDNHLLVKTGIEYNILEKLVIRTGFNGKPYQLSAGIGFQVKKLTLDLAVAYNQYLGNSPSVSFQYQF